MQLPATLDYGAGLIHPLKAVHNLHGAASYMFAAWTNAYLNACLGRGQSLD